MMNKIENSEPYSFVRFAVFPILYGMLILTKTVYDKKKGFFIE